MDSSPQPPEAALPLAGLTVLDLTLARAGPTSSGRMWKRCCEALQRPDWLARPDWATQKGRSADRAAINAAIAEVTRLQPAAHWIALFEAAGIPCGPINRIDQVFADPQVQHLGIVQGTTHPRLGELALVASPLSPSGSSRAMRSPTPDPGADTDAVLAEAGLTPTEIARAREEGAI